MLYRLKRHPFAVKAFFRHSLVLTYAIPQDVLRPLLPPGLVLDTFDQHGFLAIALVQTRALRPQFLPAWMGCDFFLSGYRIFTRLDTPGSSLRGLRILRSDTDSRFMSLSGNLLTHYNYAYSQVELADGARELHIEIRTSSGEANLDVVAYLDDRPAELPEGSPFPDLHTARKFAGPLPFTFDYEVQTGSIISVRGLRGQWDPKLVRVNVHQCAFLDREPFRSAGPRLANAFYLQNVDYRWERGVCVPVNRP